MPEERKKEGKNVCDCGCCGSHTGMMGMCSCGAHGGTRMLFRLLLGLIILALVFWMGVKLGELRSELYYGYGPRYSTTMRGYPSMMTLPSPTAAGQAGQ